jgi:hypothetical protein
MVAGWAGGTDWYSSRTCGGTRECPVGFAVVMSLYQRMGSTWNKRRIAWKRGH